jgi:hypothetical protein
MIVRSSRQGGAFDKDKTPCVSETIDSEIFLKPGKVPARQYSDYDFALRVHNYYNPVGTWLDDISKVTGNCYDYSCLYLAMRNLMRFSHVVMDTRSTTSLSEYIFGIDGMTGRQSGNSQYQLLYDLKTYTTGAYGSGPNRVSNQGMKLWAEEVLKGLVLPINLRETNPVSHYGPDPRFDVMRYRIFHFNVGIIIDMSPTGLAIDTSGLSKNMTGSYISKSDPAFWSLPSDASFSVTGEIIIRPRLLRDWIGNLIPLDSYSFKDASTTDTSEMAPRSAQVDSVLQSPDY